MPGIVAPDEEQQQPDGSTADERPQRRIPGWVLYGAAALVVMIAIVPAVFALNPRLYAASHHVRGYYESWSADRHRASASNCISCHLEPGWRGIVTYPMTFYGEMFASVSGGFVPTPPTTLPRDTACQRSGCHSLNRLTSFSGDIAADHRAHALEAEVPCVKCHPGAGHNGQEGRFMLPPMSLCEECHADVMDQCTYCHIGRALPGERE